MSFIGKCVIFTETTSLTGDSGNLFQTLLNGYVCKQDETFSIWKMTTGRFSIFVNL